MCATTPSFVFAMCHHHWILPSSFFMLSLGEQVGLLLLQGLAPIIVWCSCVCDGWCYVSSCSPLSFYVQKIRVVKSDVGCCHHHHKGLASFCCHHFVQVSNVMPWPNCYGGFCLLICFSRRWSFEASMVSSLKHLLFLCVHGLNLFHHCFVYSLVLVCCCLCVQVLEAKKGKIWHIAKLDTWWNASNSSFSSIEQGRALTQLSWCYSACSRVSQGGEVLWSFGGLAPFVFVCVRSCSCLLLFLCVQSCSCLSLFMLCASSRS